MRGGKRITLTALVASAVCLICLQGKAAGPQTKGKPRKTAGTVVVPPKTYKPRRADALSDRGKDEFAKLDCAHCHSVNNVGGSEGPVLDGVGARRSDQFLYRHLANDPTSINKFGAMSGIAPAELPPHPRVAAETARSLVAYLLTLSEPAGGFRITTHPGTTPDTEHLPAVAPYKPAEKTASAVAGQKLYLQFGCAQCHSIEGIGGDLGPALDGIGAYHGKQYVAAHINNAQVVAVQNSKISEFVPTPMPKFNITPQEIDQITDYLLTLPERH